MMTVTVTRVIGLARRITAVACDWHDSCSTRILAQQLELEFANELESQLEGPNIGVPES